MKEKNKEHNIHIGSIIKAKVEERGFTEVKLSKLLHCHLSNIYNVYSRENINTDLLWRLSIILDYNFFTEIYGISLNEKIDNKLDNSTTTIVFSAEKVMIERVDGITQTTEYKKINGS